MKTIMTWIDDLPSPWRHALITLAVTEAGVAVNAFAGATTYNDLRLAVIGLPLALIVAGVRWAQQQVAQS